jgi:hypothetical protein
MRQQTLTVTIPIIKKLFACVACKYYSKKNGKSQCTLKDLPVSEVGLECKPKKSWRET